MQVTETTLVTAWPTKEQIEQFGEDGAWQNFGGAVSLRDRDLRYGNFSRSTLAHADLRNANLQSAELLDVNLQGAELEEANLQDASLFYANLQGADLFRANLQGARLGGANLQDGSLSDANLQGADLGTDLQGAVLMYANLQGANLWAANLQGAVLMEAGLQGADLRFAKLQGAYLGQANLQGADLRNANLEGTVLRGANLQGAHLGGARLIAADLQGARLWRTVFPRQAPLWAYADLRGATVDRPSAEEIEAWKKAIQEVTHEGARNTVLEVLRRFEQNLDRDGTPAFPDDWHWRTEADVLFDPDALYAQGWAPPPPIREFHAYLAKHLIGLACAEDALPALAEGIADRIRDDVVAERPYRSVVARTLVHGPCPPAEGLPDRTVADLKALARYAPEIGTPVAGEASAPAVAAKGEAPAVAPAAGPGERTGRE